MPLSEHSTPPAVVFTRVERYEEDTVARGVRRQFDLLGIAGAIRPGMRVTLKPNLLMKRAPEQFTTTHPMVVGCVARELQRLGVTDITIADSPGGPYTRTALEGVYRASGMAEVCARTGARLNTGTQWSARPCGGQAACASFNLIQPITEADMVINLPKLKTHGMVTLSAAVKNLFGCIPGLQKPELHYRFPDERDFCGMLLDLARVVSPAFTIVDAVVSMEGDGPSGGTARQTGFLAGAANPFALDVAIADRLGFRDVRTVSLSIERGWADGAIECLGDEIPRIDGFRPPRTVALDFLTRLPGWVRPIVQKVAEPKPRVSARLCVGCGKCAESCPAHTIELRNGKAEIIADGCIRCFCCHEMCPVKAIGIRRMGLFSF